MLHTLCALCALLAMVAAFNVHPLPAGSIPGVCFVRDGTDTADDTTYSLFSTLGAALVNCRADVAPSVLVIAVGGGFYSISPEEVAAIPARIKHVSILGMGETYTIVKGNFGAGAHPFSLAMERIVFDFGSGDCSMGGYLGGLTARACTFSGGECSVVFDLTQPDAAVRGFQNNLVEDCPRKDEAKPEGFFFKAESLESTGIFGELSHTNEARNWSVLITGRPDLFAEQEADGRHEL
jgi:hypothetical protein